MQQPDLDQAGRVFGRMRIPRFLPGDSGPKLSSARAMNRLVDTLNSLLRMQISEGARDDIIITDSITRITHKPDRRDLSAVSASTNLIAAYWTFDESPLPINYTDSVSAQLLNVGGGSANTVTTGLIGNASRFNNGGFNCGYQTPGFGDGSLGYPSTSKGFSFWYWLRIHVQPSASNFYQQVIWNHYNTVGPAYFSILTYIYPVTGVMQLQFVDTASTTFNLTTAGGTFPSVTDTWYLIGGTYDNVAGAMKMYLNGSQVGTLTFSPVLSFVDTGQLKYENGNTDFTCVWDIDESGYVIAQPLTALQWTRLYNGGAGLTWPAVNNI